MFTKELNKVFAASSDEIRLASLTPFTMLPGTATFLPAISTPLRAITLPLIVISAAPALPLEFCVNADTCCPISYTLSVSYFDTKSLYLLAVGVATDNLPTFKTPD